MRFCELFGRVVIVSAVWSTVTAPCALAQEPTSVPTEVSTQGAEESLRLLEQALALGDPEKVITVAAPLAESGNREAIFVMALFEDLGAGVRLDRARATSRLMALAKQRDATGAWYLYHRAIKDPSTFPGSPLELAELVKGMERPKKLLSGLELWLTAEDDEWKPHYFMAYPWIQREAEAGNVVAIANMVDILDVDTWVERDPKERALWLQKLVERGEPWAMRELGAALMKGAGVATNGAEARRLLEAAAAKDDAAAWQLLGEGFEKGTFGAVEFAKAREAYGEAAKRGDKKAGHRLIAAAWHGELGGEAEPKKAFELTTEAAKNDVSELLQLGAFYQNGVGVAADPARALEIYEEAAEKGNWEAVERVRQLEETPGLDRTLAESAKAWREATLKKGSPELRMDYFNTQMRYAGVGLAVDMKGIFKWLEANARLGSAYYEYHVGLCLLDGLGVEKDQEEAVHWFQLAAEQGNGRAWIALGNCARDGVGCRRDFSKAFRCYESGSLVKAGGYYLTVVEVNKLFGVEDVDLERFKSDVERFINSESRVRQNPEYAAAVVDALHRNDLEQEYKGVDDFFDLVFRVGEAHGSESLFVYYMSGVRLPFDLERARKCMERVVAHNLRYSALLRAEIDLYTPGVEAEKLRLKAIEKLEAQDGTRRYRCRYALARAFTRGIGVQRDYHRARVYADEVSQSKATRSDKEVLDSWGWLSPTVRTEEEFQKECEKTLSLGGNQSAKPFETPMPEYPRKLDLAMESGSITYAAVFGIDGRVSSLRIERATNRHFARAAFEAVQNWRMIPELKEGHFVKALIYQTIDFKPSVEEKTDATPDASSDKSKAESGGELEDAGVPKKK